MNFNSLYPKKYIEREIENQIGKFLLDREVIVIRGPRQSGKTTLLLRLGKIIEEKHRQKVYFLNLEDELEQIKFEKDPRQYLEFYLRGEKKVFFLIDEVQYLKKGGRILKLLFDAYPEVKLIVSGSSSLDINRLGESLVGRGVFFELFPFSFAEFLKTKDQKLFSEYQAKRFNPERPKKTDSVFKEVLNRYLGEYLTFGGYPRVVLEKDREKKKILLKNIFSTYIEKDIIKLYGIKYRKKVIVLLKYLSATLGSLLNFQEISRISGLHFQEIKELLTVLEETYVLKRISPYHRNLVTELKKNPKVYFYDLGLRQVLVDRFEFSEDEWGRIYENYGFLVFKQMALAFWRTTAKAEVDFILKDRQIPVEIKTRPRVSRSFLSYLETYRPEVGVLANREVSDVWRRKETPIYLVPWALL